MPSNSLTRRSALGLIGAGAVVSATGVAGRLLTRDDDSQQPPAMPAGRPTLALSRFGVDRFSNRDQQAALSAAFAAAASEGFALTGDPEANYRHDGALHLNGVSFDGQGCAFTALSDGQQVMRCVGRNWRVANVTLLGAARARNPDPYGNGIWVGDANEPAVDFVVENVRVGAAGPGRGFAGTGYMFINAHRGRIVRAQVRNSFADGIHVTHGSTDLVFETPICRDTGDDGFAIVSYRAQNLLCRRIRVSGAQTYNSLARGLTVAGAEDVEFTGCRAVGSSAAGLYLMSDGAWDTYGVRNVRVVDTLLQDCVTGVGQDANFRHSVVLIGGRSGSDIVEGGRLDRAAVDCRLENLSIQGCGAHTQAGVATLEFAIRPHFANLSLSNLVSPSGRDHPNGFQIGGRDVVIDGVEMTEIAGVPITMAPSASGRALVRRPRVNGGRTRPGPIDTFLYFEPAPRLVSVSIENGEFARGPRSLSNVASGGKVRMINNRLNGVPVN